MTPKTTPETGTGEPIAPADRPGPSVLSDRYGALPLDERRVVVYDRENAAAWIESTEPVPLGGGVDG